MLHCTKRERLTHPPTHPLTYGIRAICNDNIKRLFPHAHERSAIHVVDSKVRVLIPTGCFTEVLLRDFNDFLNHYQQRQRTITGRNRHEIFTITWSQHYV